jgi:hypothetical protein
MINPLLILAISWVKVLVNLKPCFQYFNMLNILQYQVAVAGLAPGLGKTQHLPAHQHYAVTGCAADAVRVNYAYNRFATHGNTASPLVFRCAPQQLRYFFHSIRKVLITKDLTGLVRESNKDLSGLAIINKNIN